MAVGMNRMEDTIYYKIVKSPLRERFVKYVKRPLRLALVKMAERYPPVNKGTLNLSSSMLLEDMHAEFMRHEVNALRGPMIDAAWKILIAEYDHDIYYRRRFDWVLKKMVELVNSGKWVFESGEPYEEPYSHCWNEDWTVFTEKEINQMLLDGKIKPGMYTKIMEEVNGG